MTYIFISYSRVDKKITKELAELLSHSYDHVWHDTAKLTGGEKWWETILSKIETCDHFIFLLSPESIASEYCQRELEEAIRLGKHIIPLRIRERTDIPDTLKSLQCIDSFGEITVDGLNKIYASIVRFSGGLNSSNLSEKQNAADLKLLKTLWPFINSTYFHFLLEYEVDLDKIDVQKYQNHIPRYLHLRNLEENKFYNLQIENIFTSFDKVLKAFDGILSRDWETESEGNKHYKYSPKLILDLKYQGLPKTNPYQYELTESLDSMSEIKKLVELIRENHKALIQIIRGIVPDFDFSTDNNL